MERYFKQSIEFEELLNSIYKSSNEDEIESLIYRLRKSDYLSKLKMNQNMQKLSNNSNKVENKLDGVCQIFTDIYISKAMQNIKLNGEVNKSQTIYHRHNHLELIYVYKGQYTQYIGKNQIEYNKGDLCLINPQVGHREGPISKDDFCIYICINKNIIDEKLLKDIEKYEDINDSKKYINFRKKGKDLAYEYIYNIVKEFNEKEIGSLYMIKGYVHRLLNVISKQYDIEIGTDSYDEKNNNVFIEIDSYIKQNLETVSREELAEVFHYNPNHINRIIKQNTGTTYINYLKELKLNKSLEMLIEGKYSVNEIISRIGYTNKTHFYKLFSQKYNTTPNKYKIK